MIFLFSLKIITRYRRIGYNLNVMRQSACFVFNQIMAHNYAAIFNCTPVDRASDSMMASIIHVVGWGRRLLSVAWPTGVKLVFLFCSGFSVSYWAPRDLHRRAAYSICESSFLIHQDIIMIYLFAHDDSLSS